MRITQLDCELLRVPLGRPVTGPDDPRGPIDHVFLLIAYVDTDAGHRGLGIASCVVQAKATAARVLAGPTGPGAGR